MNTFVHNLENNFSKLTIHKTPTDGDDTSQQSTLINKNVSLLLPMNTEKITALNLSNCNLTELPDWFKFKNLIEVDLSFNALENVPHLIYTNKKLQTLNIANNKIQNFDMKPKCCSFLLDLNVSGNRLENIPSWIYSINCDDLETLRLSNNPFEYRKQLSGRYLKNLKTLELNNSNVRLNENKTRFLTEIPKLEKLFLCNVPRHHNINFIKELNFQQFAFVPFLKELHLVGLGISTIPECFVIFDSLEVLNVKKNFISWFPSNFTRLTHLKVLIVSQNDLLSLPCDIHELKHLEKLYISDNCVGSLPASITKLEHLETLDCYNNDLTLTENIMEVINNIPSLVALDCDQNSFEVTSETYCKKREKLRLENEFVGRVNGPKIPEFYEDSSSRTSSNSTTLSNSTSYQEFWEENEPENWDAESVNSISDDMDLILPKFRFVVRDPPYQGNLFVDPVCFEDVLE